MKNYILILFVFVSLGATATDLSKPPGITIDLATAKSIAKKEHKAILLTFSGSDWCIPCIRLEKEVFTADPFKKFADSSLVVINADFPRLKKHQLPKDKKAVNESLAAQYNKQGNFPFTVLLDADGKVIKTWDGNTVGDANSFIAQLQKFVHDR
jgi:thioredoxin-related protein